VPYEASRDRKGGSDLNKNQKAQVVESLNDRFQRAKGVVIAEYKGLTVEEMTSMRRSLREANLEFTVVKNTLARRAIDGTPSEPLKDSLQGPIGVALGYEDPVVLAKTVLEQAKVHQLLKPLSAVIEGKLCDAATLKSVASLPSRDAMLGQVAGLLQSPSRKMAGLLQATVARFGYALTALHAKRGEQ